MNDILFLFLSLSLSGSILALILFLIKLFIKNKLSQTWQYYIWLVVIVRFLLPFTPQVSIVGEMSRQFQDIINSPVASQAKPDYGVNEDYIVSDVAVNTSFSVSQNTEPVTQLQTQGEINEPNKPSKPLIYWRDVFDSIWMLWIAVALALFVHKAASYQSFVRFVSAGKIKVTGTNMLGIYADELTVAKIKRPLPLYTNEHVASPMLVGILRPALVLPVLEASDNELRQIFRHELTHFKRWDFLYKWIVQITLCLHWFNPLVYMINKQINKSCELSCDESVIKDSDEDGRIIYGDALVASLAAQGKYNNFVVSITMSENVTIVKERLDKIMSYRKKSRFVLCITAMLTVIMLCGFTAAGAYTSAPNNPINADKQNVSTSNATPIGLGGNEVFDNQVVNEPNLKQIDSRLNQVTKEYTLTELKALNVSGIVVDVLSENVVIEKGGNKLVLEYLRMSDGEYVIDTQPDMGGTIKELSFRRTTPIGANEPARSVIITIPDKADFIVTAVSADSGIIRINGCLSKTLKCETKSGEITITGGSVANLLLAKSETGQISISGIATGNNFRAFLESDGREVYFQPRDNIENYQFIIDAKPQARITVNGKDHTGGDFKINENAGKTVYFDNEKGSVVFTIQDAPDRKRESSMAENFEKYKPFGIVYNSEQDAVFYNGERVKLFVDFKQDKEGHIDYAFDLCYQDGQGIGSLCLEAVEDKNGNITGISNLDDNIASELIWDFAAVPHNMDGSILTFDATLKIESYGLDAQDITKDKAPANIKTWMTECDKQLGTFIKQNMTDSGYITYIYCSGGGRYPWHMDVINGEVCVYLYSGSGLATNDGYTLLYYTTPIQYDTRLFMNDKEVSALVR